jgi:hypothetical protein
MDADKDITATFITMPPVRIAGSETGYFQTITEAYATAQAGSAVQIQAQGVVLTDSAVNLDRTVHATLKGGYGPGFSEAGGDTILSGPLTIALGSLVLERFIIR